MYRQDAQGTSQNKIDHLLYQAYATKDCTILNTAKALATSNSSLPSSLFLQMAANNEDDCSFADLYSQLEKSTNSDRNDQQNNQPEQDDNSQQNETAQLPEQNESTSQPDIAEIPSTDDQDDQDHNKTEDERQKRSTSDLNFNTSLLVVSTNQLIVIIVN